MCTEGTELSYYLWLPSASLKSAFKMLRIRISMALAFYSVMTTCHSSALPSEHRSTVPGNAFTCINYRGLNTPVIK